jgi:isochorismate hydrolase
LKALTGQKRPGRLDTMELDTKKPLRIQRARAALLVVDIQERLLQAIFENRRVVENSHRFIQAAAILSRPILATEQYRKGLGPTLQALANAIPNFKPLEKVAFSACGAEGCLAQLKAAGISDVILCGIETHVCICQTCLDLLEKGFRVFVAADAVSSRTQENHFLGLERMRDAGAIIGSTEMLIFELLERAATDEFKKLLPLVK